MSDRVVLATGNAGKLAELRALLRDTGLQVVAQSELDVPEAVEDGLSFVENALIKARNACRHTGLAAIADDSGLEVVALNGAPGIYSARYAGGAGDTANNQKLLNELDGCEDRTARFHCVMVYLRHAEDPTPIICQGSWQGEIATQPRGQNGFGYDPLFYIAELGCHSAELEPEIKNTVSHRAKALQCLKQNLSTTC
ncbi:MAG: RdgB/HAM1 family non-canonical purine NTP pyrophosphatase [Gammaproteobacteria bacterium]|nr:RdgB/HAM1 family non-canonical purine NTP pyrophosphatase [Gammaproteobacteria bacterium]